MFSLLTGKNATSDVCQSTGEGNGRMPAGGSSF